MIFHCKIYFVFFFVFVVYAKNTFLLQLYLQYTDLEWSILAVCTLQWHQYFPRSHHTQCSTHYWIYTPLLCLHLECYPLPVAADQLCKELYQSIQITRMLTLWMHVYSKIKTVNSIYLPFCVTKISIYKIRKQNNNIAQKSTWPGERHDFQFWFNPKWQYTEDSLHKIKLPELSQLANLNEGCS